jgi:hypothetical protein
LPEEEFGKYAAWKFGGAPMEDAPSTLSEFRKWWEDLSAPATVHAYFATSQNYKNDGCRATLTIDAQNLQQPKCEVARFIGNTEPFHWIDAELSPSFEMSPDFHGLINVIGTLKAKQRGHDAEVRAIVTTHALSEELHTRNMQRFFGDWRAQPYEQAFAELASLSEGLENIPLKSLVSRIAEQEPRGERALEAVGLKVPAALLTRWGIVVLLAVQFYFWLHLQEFNSKVEASSRGLDVAWIGVYRSKIALAAVLVSACVVPALAVGVLTLRMPRDLPKAWSALTALAIAVAAAVLGLALALGTGERLLKLRIKTKTLHRHPPETAAVE